MYIHGSKTWSPKHSLKHSVCITISLPLIRIYTPIITLSIPKNLVKKMKKFDSWGHTTFSNTVTTSWNPVVIPWGSQIWSSIYNSISSISSISVILSIILRSVPTTTLNKKILTNIFFHRIPFYLIPGIPLLNKFNSINK